MAHRVNKGFTIIELMVAVAVLAVLVAIAAPNLSSTIVTQRVKTATTDLHTHLSLARSEAIKRNAAVDVVPANTANWAQGWSVKVQSDSTTLFSQQAYPDITFTGPAGSVSYLGTGRISGSATVSFFIKATNQSSVTARCIHIEPSGRPAVRIDKDGDSSDGLCD
jgi:type IV fimbrial biogenesis protein FimT